MTTKKWQVKQGVTGGEGEATTIQPKKGGRIMRYLIALCFLMLTASSAQAEDTAAVAAALPDEASECRYLLRKCEACRPYAKRLEEVTAESKAYLEKIEQNPPRTQMERYEQIRWTQFHAESGQIALNELRRACKVGDAMTVIRSKHEEMPACFEQCQDVIKIEKFRSSPVVTTQGSSLEARLGDLKRKRENGELSPEEYYEKRTEILKKGQ